MSHIGNVCPVKWLNQVKSGLDFECGPLESPKLLITVEKGNGKPFLSYAKYASVNQHESTLAQRQLNFFFLFNNHL